MKKEFKTFSFKASNIQDQDQYFVFEGYASTFNNIDLGDDIVVRGAFAKSLAQTPEVPILLNHNMGELPVGVSYELYEDDKGLFVKAKLPKEDWRVSGEVMPQIKIGSVKEMSIGYYVKDYEMSKNGVRLLKEIVLFEISLVNKAMNPQALVTGFKSFASLKDIEGALKGLGLSNTGAKTLISRIKEFSSQRDVDLDSQRDVDTKQQQMEQFTQELKNIINKFNK